MKKEFHSSIDGLRLRRQKEGILIQINGWCFHEKEKIKIELYLNDKKAECEALSIARYDVIGNYPRFNIDPHVGFMVKAVVTEYLKKIELVASAENAEDTILKLSEHDIRRFIDNEVIEYSIDNYTEIDDEQKGVLVGWALDECNSNFEYEIKNELDQIIPSNVRIESRRDLVQLKMIDSSQS
ncbi:hypothetical protein, partial [uncultured Dubosiella sp.]